MTERVRIDETSHPVDIKMRRLLKHHFLRVLDKTLDEHSWDIPKQYGLMVFGSTVMRMLEGDVIRAGYGGFKLGGLKSSDIDIGGYVRDQSHRNTTTKEEFMKFFAPRLAQAVRLAGFDLWTTKMSASGNSSGEIKDRYANNELEALDPALFTGEYYITIRLTKDEIVEALKHDRHYGLIKPYIDDHFVTKARPFKTICIAISADTEHFPTFMEPDTMFHKNEYERFRIQKPRYFDDVPLLGMSNRFDMISGKLARCMGPAYKPSDLLDIYNLITHRDPMIFNYDNERLVDKGNHIDMEVVRLLTINYLACGYGYFDGSDKGLLKNFENTRENKDKVIAVLRKQIIEYKQEWLFRNLDRIYATINEFIGALFKVKTEGLAFGPLNLTVGERSYIAGLNGTVPLKAVQVAQPQGFLDRVILRRQPEVRTEVQAAGKAEFGILLDRVVEEFPCTFGFVHPRMKPNILRNSTLNAKLARNMHGAEMNGLGGDF